MSKVPPEHTLVKDLSIGYTSDNITWDCDIDVWGEYLNYRPATLTDPEEGGYFEVYSFKAVVNGVDVTDLLEVGEVQHWVNEEFY